MPSPARSTRTYRALARLVRPAMFAVTRPDWRGQENLPRDRGFIAAANHVTELDPVTMAHYLWDAGFAPRIMAKDSLFRVPGLGPLLRGIGVIPVTRGSSAAADSLAAAATALAAGECVLVFPEGTLTRDPGLWPMLGKTGTARLALASGAPVVPVAQWGAHRVLGRYQKLPRPFPRKPVSVAAGPPIDLTDLSDAPASAAREATTRIMVALTTQLAGIRDETPPDGFWDPRTDARVPA